MRSGNTTFQFGFVLAGLLAWDAIGCNSLAEVDVKCEKLCLTAPGPTIPGLATFLPAGLDAGLLVDMDAGLPVEGVVGIFATMSAGSIDAGISVGVPDGGVQAFAIDAGLPPSMIEQMIPMAYNEVLDQLPGIVAGMDADVRLSSLKVTSPMDLGFVDEIEVTLFTGNRGGGSAASVDGAVSAGSVDASFSGANSDGESPCGAAGLLVASYRRPAAGPSGSSAELTVANPAQNLFSCLKGAPANFRMRLKLAPGELPFTDTPLSMTSCMRVHANAQLP